MRLVITAGTVADGTIIRRAIMDGIIAMGTVTIPAGADLSGRNATGVLTDARFVFRHPC